MSFIKALLHCYTFRFIMDDEERTRLLAADRTPLGHFLRCIDSKKPEVRAAWYVIAVRLMEAVVYFAAWFEVHEELRYGPPGPEGKCPFIHVFQTKEMKPTDKPKCFLPPVTTLEDLMERCSAVLEIAELPEVKDLPGPPTTWGVLFKELRSRLEAKPVLEEPKSDLSPSPHCIANRFFNIIAVVSHTMQLIARRDQERRDEEKNNAAGAGGP